MGGAHTTMPATLLLPFACFCPPTIIFSSFLVVSLFEYTFGGDSIENVTRTLVEGAVWVPQSPAPVSSRRAAAARFLCTHFGGGRRPSSGRVLVACRVW